MHTKAKGDARETAWCDNFCQEVTASVLFTSGLSDEGLKFLSFFSGTEIDLSRTNGTSVVF